MKLSKDNYVEFHISENAKDVYDELITELALLNDFEYFKQNFEKVGNYITKLKQENQAYKDRWEKLKEYVANTKPLRGTNIYFLQETLLEKMAELEQGETK